MPPKRCPECGRFLSNQLVASLASGSQPCPRCETSLSADTIVGGARSSSGGGDSGPARQRQAAATPTPVERTPVASVSVAGPSGSVRPPDLDPVDVRAPDAGVLAGWDVGATQEEIDGWRRDRRPFPTDTVVVASGALLGGVAGALLTPRQRAGSAVFGVVAGAVAAAASVRLWELRG